MGLSFPEFGDSFDACLICYRFRNRKKSPVEGSNFKSLDNPEVVEINQVRELNKGYKACDSHTGKAEAYVKR